MKWLAGIGVIYLVAVGGATIYSGMASASPMSDTIAGLPSTGSLLGSTGTTAGVLDLATAGAVYYFFLHGKLSF
jgi:hypothetical protein